MASDNFYSKWPNEFAIAIATIGFLLAIGLLTINRIPFLWNNPRKPHPRDTVNALFHEIKFAACEHMDTLMDERIARLSSAMAEEKKLRDTICRKCQDTAKRFATVLPFYTAECNKLKDTLAAISKLYERTQQERMGYHAFNTDTTPKYLAAYLSVRADTLRKLLDTCPFSMDSTSVTALFTLADTSAYLRDSLKVKYANIRLTRVPFPDKMAFFNKYPVFGYWYILGILQFTLWFLMGVLVIGMMPDLKQKQGDTFSFRDYLWCCLTPFMIIGLFILVVYFGLIGDNVIKDTYFMNAFNGRMVLYSLPGYSLAGLCFGGYLYVAKRLRGLNEDYTKHNRKSFDLQQFNRLKTAFKFLFFLCAAILSVFVIWVGSLFLSVNSMDSMKYYSLISGKLFIPNDFIYLIGLVHSLLLVIFYIPVQLEFKGMEVVRKQTPAANTGSAAAEESGAPSGRTGFSDVFSTMFNNFSGVLITSSPLIISIIQSLLNSSVVKK